MQLAEFFPGKPDTEEDILDNLFGQGPVFQVLVDKFENEPGIVMDQRAEGLFIAGGYQQQQFLFII